MLGFTLVYTFEISAFYIFLIMSNLLDFIEIYGLH